jgi:DNA-binding IclR family transcriptional regulator
MTNDDITPRDKIWCIVISEDQPVWTVSELEQETDVSEQTARNTLNAMSRLGILQHKKQTKRWFVRPEYL